MNRAAWAEAARLLAEGSALQVMLFLGGCRERRGMFNGVRRGLCLRALRG
jgi:hypothetical protein